MEDARRHIEDIACLEGQELIARSDLASPLQDHDNVFRILMNVWGELSTRRMDGVVKGDVAGTHLGIDDTPVLSAAHPEVLTLGDLEYSHFAHGVLPSTSEEPSGDSMAEAMVSL